MDVESYMKSGPENYKNALKLFGFAQYAELRRNGLSTVINNMKYWFAYEFIYFQDVLKAIAQSIEELIIVECPIFMHIDNVFHRITCSEKKLRKVIILDSIPKKYEKMFQDLTNAKLVFPVMYLSKLLKSSTYKELVIDQIVFKSLMVPFKDLASFQSIKYLHIRGSFKNGHLTSARIARFIQFINGFPNLKAVEACFTLQTQSSAPAAVFQPEYQDSYDGFAFYETMKKVKASMFKDISQKVHGKIYFGASITSFESMCCSMKNNLNQSSKFLKPPIEYDEKNSIIRRTFCNHHGLHIMFSITPVSCSQEMG